MQYMLLIYIQEDTMTEADDMACYKEATRVVNELKESGHYIAAAPLHPVTTATSVRHRDGQRLVTDGPFAETREQLGGYFLVEAKDLDEAIGIAHRLPMVKWGTVEVRPVVDLAHVMSEAAA